jgi:hypothetical protein
MAVYKCEPAHCEPEPPTPPPPHDCPPQVCEPPPAECEETCNDHGDTTIINNNSSLINVGDVTVGDLNVLQNVNLLNNVGVFGSDILNNTLQGGILNQALNGGVLNNLIGGVVNGDIGGDLLSNIKITDVANGTLGVLTGDNSVLSNIASNNLVGSVVGDIASDNNIVTAVKDVVSLDALGDGLLNDSPITTLVSGIGDIGGNNILNGVLSGNHLDIIEDIVDADGPVLSNLFSGDVTTVVADVLSPDVVTGLLSGNAGSDVLDIDAVTAVSDVVSNVLSTTITDNIVGADLAAGLIGGDLVDAVLGGDDLLGGLLSNNFVADTTIASVDHVLDQLVSSPLLFDIFSSDSFHDVT